MFLKIYLFVLMLFLCSYFRVVAFAGICDEQGKSGGLSTFSGSFIVPPEWRDLKWSPDNPEEIDRNKTLAVKVINGNYPYSWSASGTGFSLDPDQTQAKGPSNKLTADDTACGTAEITVIDNDGAKVNGYVREQGNSGWVEQPQLANTCPEPGEATQMENPFLGWRVVGKVKIEEKAVKGEGFPEFGSCGRWGFCEGVGSNCNGVCNAPNCGIRGCSECLTGDFFDGQGYGCVVYPWQNIFWCSNNPCCWCVCNAYTKVYYWECNQ